MVNSEPALMLRLYGGLLGIENSSLDTEVKSYDFPRSPEILHETSVFIAEHSQMAPGYSYIQSQTLLLVI